MTSRRSSISKPEPTTPESAKALLRERGLQVTSQRVTVLQAVSYSPHATADEVADHARSVLGSISRQAVYDALSILVDKGLVRRIEPAGSPARYEDRVGDNHHHLICRLCGDVVDVDCAVGTRPCLEAGDAHGYHIDEAEVIYWGFCPTCRQTTDEASAKSVAASTGGSPPPG